MEKLTAADAAKYWGCQIRYAEGDIHPISGTTLNNLDKGLSCQLLLRPLSKITDEDAIEVAKIINSHEPYSYCLHYDASLVKKGYEFGSNKNSSLWNYDIIDFLRSRSYDCDNFISQGKAIEI